MQLMDKEKVIREADFLVGLVIEELVDNFGKTVPEAVKLTRNANVFQSLVDYPMGLHESPGKWALTVLLDNNDIRALEAYYNTFVH